jgi:hypothetical protein
MVGWHDAFPAYEVVINGQLLHTHYPQDPGPSVFNLGGWRTVNFAGVTTLAAPD